MANAHKCRLHPGSLQMRVEDPNHARTTYTMVYTFELVGNVELTNPKQIIALAQDVDDSLYAPDPNAPGENLRPRNHKLPKIGRYFKYGDGPTLEANDYNSRVLSFDVQPAANNDRCWTITVTYSYQAPYEPGAVVLPATFRAGSAAAAAYDDLEVGDPAWYTSVPEDRPARIYSETETFIEKISRKADGTQIVNKAGYLYPWDFERETSRTLLCAEWNVAGLAAAIQIQQNLEGAINTTEWRHIFSSAFLSAGEGIPARAAKCRVCRWREMNEGTGYAGDASTRRIYYKITAKFAFAKKGQTWDLAADEWSYRNIDDLTESDPKPLDTDGKWQAPDHTASQYLTTTHAVDKVYDFNTLPDPVGLPDPDAP